MKVIAIVSGYLSVLYLHWTPANSKRFRHASFFVWFVVSLYLSNLIGAYQVLVFVVLQLLHLVGFIYEVILILEHQALEGRRTTFVDAARFAFANNLMDQKSESNSSDSSEDNVETSETNVEGESRVSSHPPKLSAKSMSLDSDMGVKSQGDNLAKSDTSTSATNIRSIAQERNFLKKLKIDFRSMSLDIEDERVNTDNHMYGALYACVGMLLWKHKWMIQLLSLPIAYYLIKQIGSSCGFWMFIRRRYDLVSENLKEWCRQRQQALVPANVRGLYKIGVIVNNQATQTLKGSVDAVATTAVILVLLIFTTCTSIFITIQVRRGRRSLSYGLWLDYNVFRSTRRECI